MKNIKYSDYDAMLEITSMNANLDKLSIFLRNFTITKLKYWYYVLILRIKYNMKPNEYGTFDLKISPSFSNAKLI